MKCAIVGATGKVGSMMLTCLKEFDIRFNELTLYASSHSAGNKIFFDNEEYVVKTLSKEEMEKGFDYILFSAGRQVSREYAPIASFAGSIVIDNSSAFRQESNIPLIVPEVNGALLKDYKGIISNPNCSTIQLVLLLKPLSTYRSIKKIILTTLQSVSGAGYKGIKELHNQRKGSTFQNTFPKQIDLNVIPQIGAISENSYCDEENKMSFEIKKILNDYTLDIVVTTVRVPVVYGHSESVYIEFSDEVYISDIKNIFSHSENVSYSEDYITPLDLGESNMSHVSRVRYGENRKSIVLWNVGHNVRLGAATNAIKILKNIVTNN